MAEARGNRTHLSGETPDASGFEGRAGHQTRLASSFSWGAARTNGTPCSAPQTPERFGGSESRLRWFPSIARPTVLYSPSYFGPPPPSGVTQVMIWYGSMMSQVLQWTQLEKLICSLRDFGFPSFFGTIS